MKKIKLDILGVSNSQTQTGSFALVLGEHEGRRRLPIIIGSNEASAIAMGLENLRPPRPLTHDLFKDIFERFGLEFKELIIHNLDEGVFHAKMIVTDGLKTEEIECRSSDGIALALRYGSPIYTYEFILSSAGIVIDEPTPEEEDDTKQERRSKESTEEERDPYANMSLEELHEHLQKAISQEVYEKAAKIQAEIDKRNAT
jgi:bifunctional DNase/RNase